MKNDQLRQTTDITERLSPSTKPASPTALTHHGYNTVTDPLLVLTAASLKQVWPKVTCAPVEHPTINVILDGLCGTNIVFRQGTGRSQSETLIAEVVHTLIYLRPFSAIKLC